MLVLYSSKNTNGKWRGNICRCSYALCHAQSKEDKVLSSLLCTHKHSERNLHSIRPLSLHMRYVGLYAAYITLVTEQWNNKLIALGAKLNHNWPRWRYWSEFLWYRLETRQIIYKNRANDLLTSTNCRRKIVGEIYLS